MSRLSTTMRKMVWLRLERAFMAVSPTWRLRSPWCDGTEEEEWSGQSDRQLVKHHRGGTCDSRLGSHGILRGAGVPLIFRDLASAPKVHWQAGAGAPALELEPKLLLGALQVKRKSHTPFFTY